MKAINYIISVSAAFTFSGCAGIQLHAERRFIGHWEVGNCYEAFTTLDGKQSYYIQMPPSFKHFFEGKQPTYRDPKTGDFGTVYIDVLGYVSKYEIDPRYEMIHVVRVLRIEPPRASAMSE